MLEKNIVNLLFEVGGYGTKPKLKNVYSMFRSMDGCHCLDGISAAPLWVVKLLLGSFHYKPSSSLGICGCGLNSLCGTLLSRLVPFAQEKTENYHLGTICFPSSLNLPIWSVWHPNPRRVGCLPYQQGGWWEESVRACFWKRSLRGESVWLLGPPRSSVPPLPLLSSVSTSVTCDMQKMINSDMGAESRKGGSVAWPTSGEEEALEWGNGGRLEIGARSGKRWKKGLLTLDHGSCFDLSVHKSGVALRDLAGELRDVFAPLAKTIQTQEAYEERRCSGLLPSARTSCFTYIPCPLKNTIINHAIMLVGRDLWRLSSPNPLLKPCPVKLGYSEPVLLSLENLQGRRLHSHSGPHSSVWPPSCQQK